jgi:hypothetical protein
MSSNIIDSNVTNTFSIIKSNSVFIFYESITIMNLDLKYYKIINKNPLFFLTRD